LGFNDETRRQPDLSYSRFRQRLKTFLCNQSTVFYLDAEEAEQADELYYDAGVMAAATSAAAADEEDDELYQDVMDTRAQMQPASQGICARAIYDYQAGRSLLYVGCCSGHSGLVMSPPK